MRRTILWFSVALGVLLVVAIHARLLLPVARPTIVATGSLRAGLAPLVDGVSRRGGLLLLESALDGMGATADRRNHKNNVLLLDAGNSLFADNSSPQLADEFPQIMAELGYDAMSLGYRDFEVLARLSQPIKVPIIACNIRGRLGRQSYVPRHDFEVHGLRVRVIGIVDPIAAVIQDAHDLAGVTVLNLEDSIAAAQAQIEQKPRAAINVILSSTIDASINVQIARKLPEGVLIIGLANGGRGGVQRVGETYIATAQTQGQSLVVAGLSDSRQPDDPIPVRPGIVDVVSDNLLPRQTYRDRLRTYWIERKMKVEPPRIVGAVGSDKGIPGSVDHQIVLSYPYWTYFMAPMHSFVADAIRVEFPQWETEHMHPKVASPVDVVLVNSGSIERGLPAGVVTSTDLKGAIPYDNRLVPCQMSGKMLLDILASTGMREHGMIGVSGLKYVWDYNTGAPVPGSVMVVDKAGTWGPLDPAGQFRVVINDFLATGGDDYLDPREFHEIVAPSRADPYRFSKDEIQFPHTVEIVERFLLKNSPVQPPVDQRVRFIR
jgi:2',3'-cyclic-nucleotide 2'-phosphodiesterase (5'-nucleotidase family)